MRQELPTGERCAARTRRTPGRGRSKAVVVAIVGGAVGVWPPGESLWRVMVVIRSESAVDRLTDLAVDAQARSEGPRERRQTCWAGGSRSSGRHIALASSKGSGQDRCDW